MTSSGERVFYVLLKRGFDVAVATSALLLLAPVLFLLALAVIATSPGPALYKAPRVGRGGRDFLMFKFRSMIARADHAGPSSTAADDPRITPIGHVMRRFKLDELPQLLNVVRGDMSLVGPRPQVRWAVELYSPEERDVLSVRPGVTDFASLKYRNEGEILRGSSDPDKAYLEMIAPGKLRLGLVYVRTRSFWVDAKIVVATALSVAGVPPEWCLPDSERKHRSGGRL